jgi:ABC-type proline/glycine betaine transport system permease subunit
MATPFCYAETETSAADEAGLAIVVLAIILDRVWSNSQS